MKKFECLIKWNLSVDELNKLGENGWELISVIQDLTFRSKTFIYYLKREKQ